ncbi:MAG: hypothetical protein H0U88_01560 [Chthoniobacterales bacterium]|nr:hypothetical protein [Chthoniobacterales bacterium]
MINILQDQKRELACELHDGLTQSLTAMAMNAKQLQMELEAEFSSQAEAAGKIVRRLNDAVGHARQIAHGLHPIAAESKQLTPALKRLLADTQQSFGIRCTLQGEIPLSAETDVGLHLYRIVQQSIDNAIRHGRARSVAVAIEASRLQYRLRIRDDGSGFDLSAHPAEGIGLRTMRFRADLLGAEFRITSQPDKGTAVEVSGALAGLLQPAAEPVLERHGAP